MQSADGVRFFKTGTIAGRGQSLIPSSHGQRSPPVHGGLSYPVLMPCSGQQPGNPCGLGVPPPGSQPMHGGEDTV